jgi:hypothetical protein
MQNFTLRIVSLAIMFLVIMASGIWLSNYGKPYSTLIISLHKIIALMFAIFAGMIIYQLQKPIKTTPVIIILIIIITVLILAMFVSGALLSLDKPAAALVIKTHKITPMLSAFFIAFTLYLIIAGKK